MPSNPLNQSTNPFLRMLGGGTTPQAQEAQRTRDRADFTHNRDKRAAEATGGRRGRLIQAFGQVMQEGGDLGTVLSNPDLQDVFSDPNIKGADMAKLFGEIVNSARDSVSKSQFTLPAGSGRFDQDGNTIASQPTTDVQEAEFALKGPKEALAITNAANQTDGTMKERATAQLEADGIISREERLKINAGVIQFQQVRGPDGRLTSEFVRTDLTTGKTMKSSTNEPNPVIDNPSADPRSPTHVPGASPETTKGATAIQELDRPSDMFITGLVPSTRKIAGGIVGQEFPALSGQNAKRSELALKQLRAAVIEGPGGPNRGRGNLAIIQARKEFLPNTGITSNPIQQIEAGISLHNNMTNLARRSKMIIADANKSAGIRGKAEFDLEFAERVLDKMGGPDAMKDLVIRRTELEQGEGGQETVSGAVSKGLDTAKQVLGKQPTVTIAEIEKMSVAEIKGLKGVMQKAGQTFSESQLKAIIARLSAIKSGQ